MAFDLLDGEEHYEYRPGEEPTFAHDDPAVIAAKQAERENFMAKVHGGFADLRKLLHQMFADQSDDNQE